MVVSSIVIANGHLYPLRFDIQFFNCYVVLLSFNYIFSLCHSEVKVKWKQCGVTFKAIDSMIFDESDYQTHIISLSRAEVDL